MKSRYKLATFFCFWINLSLFAQQEVRDAKMLCGYPKVIKSAIDERRVSLSFFLPKIEISYRYGSYFRDSPNPRNQEIWGSPRDGGGLRSRQYGVRHGHYWFVNLVWNLDGTHSFGAEQQSVARLRRMNSNAILVKARKFNRLRNRFLLSKVAWKNNTSTRKFLNDYSVTMILQEKLAAICAGQV